MRKVFIAAVAAFSTMALSQSPPVIVGHMPMKEQGKLVFSSETCEDESSRWVGFLQDANGKILLPICWTFVEDKVFVVYGDGDRYTYPIESMQFTRDFSAWADRKNEKETFASSKSPEQTL